MRTQNPNLTTNRTIILFLLICFGACVPAQAQYTLGQSVLFYGTIPNNNKTTLDNVIVVDTLPADLTYTGCSGGTSCSDASGLIIWNIGDMAPGASAPISLTGIITTCSSNSIIDSVSVYYGNPATIFYTSAATTYTVACNTNTPTYTYSPTQTYTPSNTPTSTDTFTPSYTPTWTGTPTSTGTPTLTFTPSNTPTVTNTFTASNTPTFTSTPTNTGTPTVTSTPTNTGTPTLTYTPTCSVYVWPDPFDPNRAVMSSLKISCMGGQSTVSIFTISGELVQTLDQSDICQIPNNSVNLNLGTIYCWNGRNKQHYPVATGVYFYVAQNGAKVIQRGKFLLTNGS